MTDAETSKLAKAVRRRPEDADLWEELAHALERQGQREALLGIALEALAHHPRRRGLELRARRALLELHGVLGDPRLQHGGYVRAVATSPDGRRLLTAGDDGRAWIWDRDTGLPLGSLGDGHSGAIRCLAVHPDGERVLTGSNDHSCQVHELEGPARSTRLPGHRKAVLSARVFPDGQRAVTASADTTCRVFDLRTREELLCLSGSLFPVQCCDVSPDGRWILSGSLNRSLTVWDARTGAVRAELHGHRGWIQACAFAPDGARVLSGSQDGTCRVWDWAAGREVLRIRAPGGSPVLDCDVSPDGERVVLATRDGSVAVFDTRRGEEVLATRAQRGALLAACFTPDGAAILCGGADGTARLLDAESGRDLLPRLGATGQVTGCFFLSGGAEVATASEDGTLRLNLRRTGEELQRLSFRDLRVRCATADPTGRVVALGGTAQPAGFQGSPRGVCHLWFPDRPLQEVVLDGPDQQGLRQVALSPDGRLLLTASEDRQVHLWDTSDGRLRHTLEERPAPALAAAFSPDGTRLALAAQDRRLTVLDATREFAVLAEMALEQAADALLFVGSGPSPKVAAGCRDGHLRLLSPDSGRAYETRVVAEGGALLSLAAAGPWLAVGTESAGLRLLDAETLAEILAVPAAAPVRSCALSPDLGHLVLSQGCHVRLASTHT